MSNSKVTVQFPILFFLFLTFLVLKLTKVITWSWWWVTCPLWGAFALVGLIAVVGLLFVTIRGDMVRRR